VLQDVQRALRTDEVLIDFAVAEPSSYAVIITRERARIQRLPDQGTVQRTVEALMEAVHAGLDADEHAKNAGQTLLAPIPELANHARTIVSPDGDLHRLPFELLVTAAGRRLLETHVVSYVPSGSVLSVLRERRVEFVPRRATLAITASPLAEAPVGATNGVQRTSSEASTTSISASFRPFHLQTTRRARRRRPLAAINPPCCWASRRPNSN
jgi:hypothetical protein